VIRQVAKANNIIRDKPSSKFTAISICRQIEQCDPVQSWSRFSTTKVSAKTAAHNIHAVKTISEIFFLTMFILYAIKTLYSRHLANELKLYQNYCMNVLIVGNRSNVFTALVEEYKKAEAAGSKYICALIPADNQHKDKENQYIEWNPASPVSARSVFLSAANNMGGIDTVIICVSSPLNETLDLMPATIDTTVDNFIKGPMFLLREAQKYFSETHSPEIEACGTLALVMQDKGAELSPLSSVIAASWSAFVHCVTAAHSAGTARNLSGIAVQNDQYKTVGFNCAVNKFDQILDFSAFDYKTLNDQKKIENGKLFKFKKIGF
jgi:hypothetical protein